LSEEATKQSLLDRLRWWMYQKCFAYCIHCMHPEADASEFSIIDDANFVAISRDAIAEIIEESPASAWRFAHEDD
jgi:hypothetical protein